MGLLLLAAAGCGYRQTKMVAMNPTTAPGDLPEYRGAYLSPAPRPPEAPVVPPPEPTVLPPPEEPPAGSP
jgi:hypothetical protein